MGLIQTLSMLSRYDKITITDYLRSEHNLCSDLLKNLSIYDTEIEPYLPPSSWWRHRMETFSALLAICAGNSPVPGEFPHTKASDAELWCFLCSLNCIWKKGGVNTRETGNFRRYRAQYDVTVMSNPWRSQTGIGTAQPTPGETHLNRCWLISMLSFSQPCLIRLWEMK